MQYYKNFIDGKGVDSESKEIIEVDDPATEKLLEKLVVLRKQKLT